MFLIKPYRKFFLSLNGKTSQTGNKNNTSRKFDDALMPPGWLQSYFNSIQTPDTFENRSVVPYNPRKFARIFSA